MKKTNFTETFIKKLHPESKKYTKGEGTGVRIKLRPQRMGKNCLSAMGS